MVIAKGNPRAMSLPAYELTAFTALERTVFAARDWSGVPKATDPLKTPVYHRGMCLAQNRYDPDAEDPLPNYPLFATCPARFMQYGGGWGASGKLWRAPTVIVFNNDLAPGTTSTQTAGVTSPNRGLNTGESILAAMADDLADANAFTAGFHTDGILDFYSFGMPTFGRQTVTLDGNSWNDEQVDPDRFVGGNLLILYAGYTYEANSTFAYYHTVNNTGTVTSRTETIAYQRAKLESCLDRFNVFRQYVYLRESVASGGAPATHRARADGVNAAYQAMAGSAAGVNVTIRGIYNWDADLSGQIQTDVRSFLAEVEG